MGETGPEPVHRVPRAGAVGERDLDPGVLVHLEERVGEQGLEVAGEPGQATGDRCLDELGAGHALGVEVDEPGALAVVGLRERVGQRGAAVADRVGERVPAVQVAEGDVVDAVERGGGHPRHPADADVALGVGGLGAGDEGVGHHDRAGAWAAAGEVGADADHGGVDRGLVGPGRQLPGLRQGARVEVGQGVDRDGAVLVLEQDRGADRRGRRADEDAGGVDEAGAEAEPLGGVVVAAGDDDLRR